MIDNSPMSEARGKAFSPVWFHLRKVRMHVLDPGLLIERHRLFVTCDALFERERAYLSKRVTSC